MVIRGYCIEIVLKFYFRDIFGIRIISKIYPGLLIIQTPPNRAPIYGVSNSEGLVLKLSLVSQTERTNWKINKTQQFRNFNTF